MDWVVFISSGKDIALAAAAVTTAVAAVRGFTSWREELQGRATFDAARAMARATYALRNAIDQARAPWMDGSEFPPAFSAAGATAKDRADGYAHVFNDRLKPIHAAIDEFDLQTLEAEALWGPSVKTCANDFRIKVFIHRNACIAIVQDAGLGGANFADRKFAERMRVTAWGLPDDTKNEFSNELRAAIGAIEALLKPHLRPYRAPSLFID